MMSDNPPPHVRAVRLAHTRPSWAGWYRTRIAQRRFVIGHDSPHNQHSWARVFKLHDIPLPRLTSHAPWLNADYLAFARSMPADLREKNMADGFFFT